MKDIFLRASDLAKLTGHNRFNDIQEIIDQILQSNQICDRYVPKSRTEGHLAKLPPEEFKDITRELCLPEKSTVQEVEAKVKQIVLKDSYSAQISESESKTRVEENLKLPKLPLDATEPRLITAPADHERAINEHLGGQQVVTKPILQVLESPLKQDLQMKRGNIKENDNLNQVQQKRDISIGSRNSQMFVKELYSSDTYRVLVRGMVDGISDDILIETKNRTKRLFHELRDYERVQLEAYFFLTGLQKALLTEHYNDKSNEIEYSHDEDFWCKCVEKICQFIETEIVINMD